MGSFFSSFKLDNFSLLIVGIFYGTCDMAVQLLSLGVIKKHLHVPHKDFPGDDHRSMLPPG